MQTQTLSSNLHISQLVNLLPAEQEEYLQALTNDQWVAMLHDWSFLARPNQIPPTDREWFWWLYLAGRGSGKTRSGAEWVRQKVKEGYKRIALVAPTAADARDVMVEGESGLMSVCWSGDIDKYGLSMGVPTYNPSVRRVQWANGAQAITYSAETPRQLRGPQHDAAWCDEVAVWKEPQTLDMLLFGLRLGTNPQGVITTTPQPVKLIKELVKDPSCVITKGSTFDNAGNLAPTFLKKLKEKYNDTRLGRQELYAELLAEAAGALWSYDMLQGTRVREHPEMKRIVVALDPAVTSSATSDETGLIVGGIGEDDLGYVLEDASGRYSPDEWAKKAVELYHKYKADLIIGEANNGGDLIKSVIKTQDSNANFRKVHASKGKRTRAEPVAALYEQGRIKHFVEPNLEVRNPLEFLEDQLCTWEPNGKADSPDRLDAMVWAFTELFELNRVTLDNSIGGASQVH